MLKGSCHCGAVKFELDDSPEWLTVCNCSICRRLGAVWAHSDIPNIKIVSAPDATFSYAQGDKTLAIHTCKTCGCTTHWESLQAEETSFMAVNTRMIEPADIADIRVRVFDGADTWKYLD